MRFMNVKMLRWWKNRKIVVIVGVIVLLIIVVTQARPPMFDDKGLNAARSDNQKKGIPGFLDTLNAQAPLGDQVKKAPGLSDHQIKNAPFQMNQNVVGQPDGKMSIGPKKSENRPPLQGALLNFGAEKGPNAVNVGADRKDKVKNKGGLREQEEPDAIPDGAGKHKSDKDLKLAGMRQDGKFVQNSVHEKLQVDDLQPDHLDAVKLEQDGHLNREYKKEIFWGNHEEIEKTSEQEREKKLKDIFNKVDANTDLFVTLGELEEWIIQKVQEHLDEAQEENEKVFHELDMDGNGLIDWKEFHVQFLVAKGHDSKEAEKHAEDYETIAVDAGDKGQLIRYKFRWAEADEDPQDNQLNLEEFKSFRHPEQSHKMLTKMVQDIIDNLDHNNDGYVSEKEFAALPPGDTDAGWAESDKAWQEERRKEFRNVIDLNRDGKVSKDELKTYVDPSNPNHASLEAKNLIALADTNNDAKLSITEVLENMDLFLGSKMVDTGRNFHDEF